MSTNHWLQNPWRVPLVFTAFAVILSLLNCKASPSRDQQLSNSPTPSPEPTLLVGHEVTSVAFSPDGKTIVSGSLDGKVILWDAQTGEVKHIFRFAEYCSIRVAFSPDSKMLASGSRDKTIRLWDLQTGQHKLTLTSARP